MGDCLTLHRWVDWNIEVKNEKGKRSEVSPYIGEWIEIGADGVKKMKNHVSPYIGEWIEISEIHTKKCIKVFHLTQVSGLK